MAASLPSTRMPTNPPSREVPGRKGPGLVRFASSNMSSVSASPRSIAACSSFAGRNTSSSIWTPRSTSAGSQPCRHRRLVGLQQDEHARLGYQSGECGQRSRFVVAAGGERREPGIEAQGQLRALREAALPRRQRVPDRAVELMHARRSEASRPGAAAAGRRARARCRPGSRAGAVEAVADLRHAPLDPRPEIVLGRQDQRLDPRR